jgi:hypothetical protein
MRSGEQRERDVDDDRREVRDGDTEQHRGETAERDEETDAEGAGEVRPDRLVRRAPLGVRAVGAGGGRIRV